MELGQFRESKGQIKAKEGVFKSHLLSHKNSLQVGSLLYKTIKRNILLTLHSNNLQQLQCKNMMLHKLISNIKSNKKNDSYAVPVINLFSKDLDTKPLKYGLHHSFTDKNKYVKRNLAVELNSLATSLDTFVDQSLKEFFHEYLRFSINFLAKHIYSDKDTTFKSLNSLRKNKDIVALQVNKESCTVILSKDDYI